MKKYNSSANVADAGAVYGYSAAQTMVTVLKACGDNLTRENVMKQAASIHNFKLPMLLPGIALSTSADDFAPIKQMQLQIFDGTTWRPFGKVTSGSEDQPSVSIGSQPTRAAHRLSGITRRSLDVPMIGVRLAVGQRADVVGFLPQRVDAGFRFIFANMALERSGATRV